MSEQKSVVSQIKTVMTKTLKSVTVEPLMLLDGFAFSNMNVYIENLQIDRVCRVSVGLPENVCQNLKAHPDASVDVQQKYSVFAFYNNIIAAVLPFLCILSMGAGSDKYGRKVPLIAVQLGHILQAGSYSIAALVPSCPVEFLLVVTLLDNLGGGTASFLTVTNSYIGDVSSEESRTSRVGLANSLWFLGGPAGTLLGTYLYSKGGYLPLFATSFTFSLLALIYTIVLLPESQGPFAKKSSIPTSQKDAVARRESVAAVYGLDSVVPKNPSAPAHEITLGIMMKDFFSPKHIFDSFKTTLRKREGNDRFLILCLIFSSLLRKLTRSPFVFLFTRHVLGWKATDYGIWVTYKNLMVTLGSLVAVPLLSGCLGVPDNILAMVGATSGIIEYVIYGCISESHASLIWIAPMAALLVNSCTIAQRAMMTKFVTRHEIGKVSAVQGALDGLMPVVNSGVYSAVYYYTVSSCPSAHFFLGASASALMMTVFSVITSNRKTRGHDVEGASPREVQGPTEPNLLSALPKQQLPVSRKTKNPSKMNQSLRRTFVNNFKASLGKILKVNWTKEDFKTFPVIYLSITSNLCGNCLVLPTLCPARNEAEDEKKTLAVISQRQQ
ncbi:uncharacterized protein LOC135205167 [Macrobrachium nipponense]|uniref:uncharacterized protein LOC135205167 n=1 Tax=Macrobrachium nipponense TaxID=159736 RepID=UPI0030C7C773